MSRQPALGKFGLTKSIDRRGLQRDIKLPDFAAKMQKAIMCSEYIKVFINQQGLSLHVKCFNVLTKKDSYKRVYNRTKQKTSFSIL